MFGTLRTLLAINVVLLHIFNVYGVGNYAVSAFFLLSGFLMTFVMQESYQFSKRGFVTFWLNRMLRLYPIYWVVLLLTLIGLVFLDTIPRHPDLFMPDTLLGWFSNLTMLYPKIVPHNFEPRLVPPSWALTNELLFYFLISIGISKTKLRTMLWLLLSVGYFGATYLFYDIPTYRYSAVFASSLPFALGASLYWFKNQFPTLKSPLLPLALYVAFMCNALYGHQFLSSVKEISIYLNYILSAALIVTLFKMIASRKVKKWDTYIGHYSYPIYLVHFLAAMVYTAWIGVGVKEGTFKLNLEAMLPYGLLLVGCCFILVHLVDIPVSRIKSKMKRKRLDSAQ